LKILQAANGGPIKIPLPLGSKGKFDGVEYIVIGYMLRGIRMEGVLYTWSEYLLYHEKKGFRWLEHSDNHWSFIETLPPGAVGMQGNNACYDDKTFRWFQRGEARVKAVAGEFYWKVSVGERVFTSDYVLPPESLSREYTEYGENKGEINWSHGRYLQVREVEQAFGLKEPLPRPSTIAPSQPFPYSGIYWYGAAFAITTILLGIIFFITGRRSTVFENTYEIAPTAAQATAEGGNVFFTRPFALHDNQNVEITASAESTNFWLGIDGDLVEEKTGVVQGFSTSVEYYAGVDEGESWSEGSKESSVCVSALPEGEYSLRLEVFGEPRNPPLTLHVRVRQNVPRFSHWFMAMLAVTAIPLAVGGYNVYFESCRWRDSNVVNSEGGGDDDD
jgi:hypothetical protein